MTTFQDLVKDEALLAAIEALGFEAPTPVQAATIGPALEGKDLIVQAQTGSGKTLAFGIPLIGRLSEEFDRTSPEDTFALVIVPTRELANQVADVLSSVSPEAKPVLLIGGVPAQKQRTQLKKDARVVVGTPGRILDFLRSRTVNLKRCRYFVLDEADEMFSMGMYEDVRAILQRLPNKRQGLFVSATISPRVEMLAGTFLTDAEKIEVDVLGKDLPPIEHSFCKVGPELTAKASALCDIIETTRPRSAIVFCNTKSDTEMVEVFLRRRGFDARRINSDLNQKQRDRVLQKIRAGELQFLLGTDIAARGLDIDLIDLVINYSIHEEPDIYLHRTGRTGRAGRQGRAISLVGPADALAFRAVQKVVDAEFTEISLPTDEEVAEARLAHLYEILRKRDVESEGRDQIVARKLITELGEIETPPEDLTEIIAKLCHHTLEHYIAQEAQSLDEEMEQAESQPQQRGRGNRNSRRDNRGGGGRGRGNRGGGGRGQRRDRGRRGNR